MINRAPAGTAADDADAVGFHVFVIDLLGGVLMPSDDDGGVIDIEKEDLVSDAGAGEEKFLPRQVQCRVVIRVGNVDHAPIPLTRAARRATDGVSSAAE